MDCSKSANHLQAGEAGVRRWARSTVEESRPPKVVCGGYTTINEAVNELAGISSASGWGETALSSNKSMVRTRSSSLIVSTIFLCSTGHMKRFNTERCLLIRQFNLYFLLTL